MAYTLTDEDRRLATQMALGNIEAQQQQTRALQQTQQPKKSAGLLGDILSIGGGALGAIGGSFLAPVAGTIGGGAAGSAAGRLLANLITGADAGDQVVEDTILGGVGGGIGKVFKVGKSAKAATDAATAVGAATPKTGILSKIGSTLETSGNKVMSSQANLTRAQARNLGVDIPGTFGSLSKRTGMGNLDDLAELATDITGKNGAVSVGVNRAVAPLQVDLGNMSRVAEDALMNRGITGTAKKEILENVKNQTVKAYGGSKGSLSSVVGGNDALAAQRFFAEAGATSKQGFKRSGNVLDKQKADVYKDLSSEINNRVYNAPGAAERFTAKGGAKDKIIKNFNDAAEAALQNGDKKAAEAYKRLGADFGKVKNIAEARTFQKDFVNIGKVADKTSEAAQGAAAQLGDTMQGAGKFIQRPLNIAAVPLNAQSGRIGQFMSSFGRKLQGTADGVASATGGAATKALTRGDLVKSLIAQGIPQTVLGGVGDTGEELSPEMADAIQGGVDPNTITNDQLVNAGIPENDVASSVIPKAGLDAAITAAALGGDSENLKLLMSLSEYLYPATDTEQTAAQQKATASASTAGATVDQLEAALMQAGENGGGPVAAVVGGIRNAAGQAGLDDNARYYNSVADSAVTQLARAISGESGALSDQDIARAKSMIPQLSDSGSVRKQKLQRIREQINATAQANAGGNSGLSSVFGGAY